MTNGTRDIPEIVDVIFKLSQFQRASRRPKWRYATPDVCLLYPSSAKK